MGLFFARVTRKRLIGNRTVFEVRLTDEKYFEGKLVKGACEVVTENGPKLVACINGERYIYVIDRKLKSVFARIPNVSDQTTFISMVKVPENAFDR